MTLQKYGRNGQSQHGIDLIGLLDSGSFLGIQCKVRQRGFSIADIQEDLTKAASFSLPLHEFIIATTAQRNTESQLVIMRRAAELSSQLRTTVWYWDDIEDELNQRPEIRGRFFGQSAFSHDSEDVTEISDALARQQQSIDDIIRKSLERKSLNRDELSDIQDLRGSIRASVIRVQEIIAKGSDGAMEAMEAMEAMHQVSAGHLQPLLAILQRMQPEFIQEGQSLLDDVLAISMFCKDLKNTEILLRTQLASAPNNYHFWHMLGKVLADQGNWNESAESIEKAIALCRPANDKIILAVLLNDLGIIFRRASRLDDAWKQTGMAVQAYAEIGDDYGLISTHRELGVIATLAHDHGQSEYFLREALRISREVGDDREIAISELALAGSLVKFTRGHASEPEAENLFRDCITLLRTKGSVADRCLAIGNYASMLTGQSRFRESEQLLKEAFELARGAPSPVYLLILYHVHARNQLFNGRLDEAEAALVTMIQSANLVQDEYYCCSGMELLSEVLLSMGKIKQALDTSELALKMARESNRPESIARGVFGVSRCLLASGRIDEACQALAEAELWFNKLEMSWMLPAVIDLRTSCDIASAALRRKS